MRRLAAGSTLFALAVLSAAPGSGVERAVCTPTALPSPNATEPMSAVPCVGGFAGIYPCSNVDLAAALPLGSMGCGSGNSVWGWTDPLDGKEYALMGCNNGIAFVDVSAPSAPIYLGKLPGHDPTGAPNHGGGDSIWRDVKVYANHAYVGSEAGGHGLQVFDLIQLRSVVSPPVTFSETSHYAGYGSSHTTAVDEASGFIYAAGSNTCSGGLHVVNVQDPANPVFAGCVADDGYVHETQCTVYSGPDADYAGHQICFNSNEDTLTIVDVTVKSNPVQISRTGYAGSGYTHQGWLTPDQKYFLLDDELDELNDGHNTYAYVWDVRDLDAPALKGHYTGPTTAIDHNLYVRGGYAYASNYRAGLRILDVTGVAAVSLQEVAYFDIYPDDDAPEFNGDWNNYPFFASGIVVVSGIEQGLFVLQPHLNPNPTSLFVSDAQVSEGNAGSATVSFTVSLSNPVPPTVSVNYATGLGNATPGADYGSTSGVLTFAPGEVSKVVDVSVFGDALDEANETFRLILSNAVNARIADASGTGTILDDDPTPSLAITDVSVAEGNAGTADAVFTVTLSAPSGQSVSALLATADGTATGGSDYVVRSSPVVLPAGTTTVQAVVQVIGDLQDETDETFLVNLTAPSNATLSDSQATATILDDDVLTVSAIAPSSGPAAGGTPVTITGVAFETGAAVTVGGAAATGVDVSGPGLLTATTPALSAGASHDVVVTTPSSGPATLSEGFFADFLDVPAAHPFHADVVTVARSGVTAGCGGGSYCPGVSVTRAQMAVFLLKSKLGAAHAPPPATGTVFTDVPQGSFAADRNEELFSLGVTGGCGGGNYCPDATVTRAQMAVFLLKTELGSAYTPPGGTGIFGDVPVGSFAADWIEDLFNRSITGGCGGGNYCPASPNTRGQMAVFMVKTFGL